MNDSYVHVDSSVIYIEENIPGPYEDSSGFEELMDAYNSQISSHCSCIDTCVYPTCKCLVETCSSNYTMQIQNGQSFYKINTSAKNPIIECNSRCSCSEECGNRLVQKGPIEGLVIKTCHINGKGLGLFATKFISSGMFICEYAGEMLTKSQAIYRNKYSEKNGGMNYIFCLNEICNGLVQQTFVDPKNFGNIGRYINHSCEPNCQIIPIRCEIPIPKLAIFSSKDILPDMEITFHYGLNNINKSSSLEGSFKNKKCMCNNSTCKKFLPYDDY